MYLSETGIPVAESSDPRAPMAALFAQLALGADAAIRGRGPRPGRTGLLPGVSAINRNAEQQVARAVIPDPGFPYVLMVSSRVRYTLYGTTSRAYSLVSVNGIAHDEGLPHQLVNGIHNSSSPVRTDSVAVTVPKPTAALTGDTTLTLHVRPVDGTPAWDGYGSVDLSWLLFPAPEAPGS